MSSPNFGWSLPPGVSQLPGEEPESPCAICLKMADDCTCEECEECGTHGCLEHLKWQKLIQLYELSSCQYHELKREYDRRLNTVYAQECPKCKHKVPLSSYDAPGYWCDNCQIQFCDGVEVVD
jgi:hypothetical protein